MNFTSGPKTIWIGAVQFHQRHHASRYTLPGRGERQKKRQDDTTILQKEKKYENDSGAVFLDDILRKINVFSFRPLGFFYTVRVRILLYITMVQLPPTSVPDLYTYIYYTFNGALLIVRCQHVMTLCLKIPYIFATAKRPGDLIPTHPVLHRWYDATMP